MPTGPDDVGDEGLVEEGATQHGGTPGPGAHCRAEVAPVRGALRTEWLDPELRGVKPLAGRNPPLLTFATR
jgi:hypothetical protein